MAGSTGPLYIYTTWNLLSFLLVQKKFYSSKFWRFGPLLFQTFFYACLLYHLSSHSPIRHVGVHKRVQHFSEALIIFSHCLCPLCSLGCMISINLSSLLLILSSTRSKLLLSYYSAFSLQLLYLSTQ